MSTLVISLHRTFSTLVSLTVQVKQSAQIQSDQQESTNNPPFILDDASSGVFDYRFGQPLFYGGIPSLKTRKLNFLEITVQSRHRGRRCQSLRVIYKWVFCFYQFARSEHTLNHTNDSNIILSHYKNKIKSNCGKV